jgi:hypothetical protein
LEKRFNMDPDNEGWTIVDSLTGRAAVVGGKALVALDFDEADRRLEQMNRSDADRRR